MTVAEKKEYLHSLIEKEGRIRLLWELGDAREIYYDKAKESFYFLRWSPRENTGEPREYLEIEAAWEKLKEYNLPGLPE